MRKAIRRELELMDSNPRHLYAKRTDLERTVANAKGLTLGNYSASVKIRINYII